jgi:hypothetical protein
MRADAFGRQKGAFLLTSVGVLEAGKYATQAGLLTEFQRELSAQRGGDFAPAVDTLLREIEMINASGRYLTAGLCHTSPIGLTVAAVIALRKWTSGWEKEKGMSTCGGGRRAQRYPQERRSKEKRLSRGESVQNIKSGGDKVTFQFICRHFTTEEHSLLQRVN